MKKKMLLMSVISILLLFMFGCVETADVSEIKERNGLTYRINSDKPYTGNIVSYYKSGKKEIEGYVKNGLPDGKLINWNKNGKKVREVNYKNGKKEGKEIIWNENGQIMLENNYKNGKEL